MSWCCLKSLMVLTVFLLECGDYLGLMLFDGFFVGFGCSGGCFSCVLVFFFFKKKTAYEMRISDWSSDVCSADLRKTIFKKRQRPANSDDCDDRHALIFEMPVPGRRHEEIGKSEKADGQEIGLHEHDALNAAGGSWSLWQGDRTSVV